MDFLDSLVRLRAHGKAANLTERVVDGGACARAYRDGVMRGVRRTPSGADALQQCRINATSPKRTSAPSPNAIEPFTR